MNANLRRSASYLLVMLATGAATFVGMRARAAGVPEAAGLTYSGYLESSEGAPLTGAHSISVQFWESEEATNPLCIGNAPNTDLQSGRFQVRLPVECTDAVKSSPNVWVDVEVDGASLGRTRLGAMPYALEAGHATKAELADSATAADSASDATGALAAQLGSIEDEIAALKARLSARGTYRYSAPGTQLTTTDWIWISGTAPATLKAGRYMVWNTGHIYADACPGGGCSLSYAQAKVAPCSRVNGTLTVAGAVNVVEPPYTADRLTYAFAANDYFDFNTDTASVELGLCAGRWSANATYNPAVAKVYTVTQPQLN